MDKKDESTFIKKTVSSLYEVENFLNKYNSFSDAISILKIFKHHKSKPTYQKLDK